MRKKWAERTCEVCGAPYYNSHERHTTCSLACGHELRRRHFREKAETALGEPLKVGIERRLADGRDMREIAKACGFTDTRAVLRIMDQLDIPRRSASDSVRLQWRDNDERRKATGETLAAWAKANPEQARLQAMRANLSLQRTSPTSIERKMMDALDGVGMTYEFQYVIGGKFACDFAFPDAMLVVECDGEYWHSTPRQRARDASKDAYLQACGWNVVRFSDKQITSDVDACVAAILILRQSAERRLSRS